MIYKMLKRATVALRSRKRVHTPREAVFIHFEGDNAIVETTRKDTMNSLRQLGWRVESKPKSEPRRLVELRDMDMSSLRALAVRHGIKGRSKQALAIQILNKELTTEVES